MATTSLKLSAELKQKATAIALDLGMTPHAFMVEAIRRASVLEEKKAEFLAQAKIARKKMLKSGVGYESAEVHLHLRQRIADASGQMASNSPAKVGRKSPEKMSQAKLKATSWRA